MIQLHNRLSPNVLIELGKALQEYNQFELGYFYAEEDFRDVVVRLYLPPNGHYVGRHPVILHFETHGQLEKYLNVARLIAQDYNTLLGLTNAKDLSNTP